VTGGGAENAGLELNEPKCRKVENVGTTTCNDANTKLYKCVIQTERESKNTYYFIIELHY